MQHNCFDSSVLSKRRFLTWWVNWNQRSKSSSAYYFHTECEMLLRSNSFGKILSSCEEIAFGNTACTPRKIGSKLSEIWWYLFLPRSVHGFNLSILFGRKMTNWEQRKNISKILWCLYRLYCIIFSRDVPLSLSPLKSTKISHGNYENNVLVHSIPISTHLYTFDFRIDGESFWNYWNLTISWPFPFVDSLKNNRTHLPQSLDLFWRIAVEL